MGKKAGATESGSDDAVNCSTHDDCSDLYPDQLDDNWLAVTDDKKPKKKSVDSTASTDDDTSRTNTWHKHAHSSSCVSDSDCSSEYTCEQGQCMPYQPDTAKTSSFDVLMKG